VRVLIFHGYLLRGTGSNVYNAELADALVRLGHEVHLVCQERNPAALGFVDAVGSWEEGKLVVHEIRPPAQAGSCIVYRPDIGGLLPVYVYDRYEGFEARTFDRLTDAELDRYLSANIAAVREITSQMDPDVAFANHLVMGPVILARALEQVPYAVKIHGSALEYTVKPHYQRFAPYAREGLARAKAILVGSRHTAESLWAAIPLHELPDRTRLGPPGVDTRIFVPRGPAEREASLEGLVRWLETAERTGFDEAAAAALNRLFDPRERAPDGRALTEVREGYDPAGIDTHAHLGLASLDLERDRIVGYVGKLIVSKGVDLLLAAWPLVLEREPRAKLVVVGFGTFREGLEMLIRGLETRDERLLSQLFRHGRALEGGERSQLTYLRAFLEGLDGRHERYFAAARKMRETIIFTGRLEHGELAALLPVVETLVVPSVFPEAFGMVAAEAAACGALPICASHSGLAEVASILRQGLPAPARPLLTFERGMQAVEGIAHTINTWLALDEGTRAAASARLAETAREHFGWEKVANGVLAAARGKLDLLDLVPGELPFAVE
jgi:glycosyltransferase involved in cell wall biosynthesis